MGIQVANSNKAQAILDVVQHIPLGRVATYSQVADLAGWPGRARAVGQVLKNVPSDTDVPWYRVIRADGTIAFPIGSLQANVQVTRLHNEGIETKGRRIALKRYQWRPNIQELLFSLSY